MELSNPVPKIVVCLTIFKDMTIQVTHQDVTLPNSKFSWLLKMENATDGQYLNH